MTETTIIEIYTSPDWTVKELHELLETLYRLDSDNEFSIDFDPTGCRHRETNCLYYQTIEIVEGSNPVTSMLIDVYRPRTMKRDEYYYELNPDNYKTGVWRRVREFKKPPEDEPMDEEFDDPYGIINMGLDEMIIRLAEFGQTRRDLARIIVHSYPKNYKSISGIAGQISLFLSEQRKFTKGKITMWEVAFLTWFVTEGEPVFTDTIIYAQGEFD